MFEDERQNLLEECRKGGKGQLSKNPAKNERLALKIEKRQNQVNNVKYDNVRILDHSGTHIFNCSEKKGLWYLKHGYGDKKSDDPMVI